jgi:O-antigen/teichoic acid export membrane protein
MIRDSGTVLASRVACIILGLATQSVLAWMLGAGPRGSYAVCIIFASMLMLIFQLGVDVASVYFVASRRFTLSEGLTYILIYGGVGGLLAVLAGSVALQMPLAFFDKAPTFSFQLALLHMLVMFFSIPISQLLIAVHDFSWSAILNILTATTHLILTVVLLLVFPENVNAALVGVMASGLFGILSSVYILCRKYEARLVRPRLSPLLAMLSYGARYYFGKLSNQVNFHIGTIILGFFAVESEIGLFSVATILATQTLMIPDALSTVLMPRVAVDEKGRHELVAQCARVAGVFCAVVLLVLCLVATPFVKLVFSPEFLPMVPLVRVMAIGVLFRSISKLFVPYLIGMNHPGTASLAVGAGVTANLLLLWLLMPRFQLNGAAMAMTGNYLLSAAILTWAFVRISKMNLRSTLQLRRSDWDPLRRIWVGLFGSPASERGV